MTVASPESVELEEQRAELNAVLDSKEFTRAPMLAHLLSCLCEKQFAGEADRIKEYSIGVEVFRRGASFDQDSDSIVRVEANRLRKRLAEYYAGGGKSHRLQITIPVGQYVPRFESASAQMRLRKASPRNLVRLRRKPSGLWSNRQSVGSALKRVGSAGLASSCSLCF